MKQINKYTFVSDNDKVFENNGQRAWCVCLGTKDSIDNWNEVDATDEEKHSRFPAMMPTLIGNINKIPSAFLEICLLKKQPAGTKTVSVKPVQNV